MMNNRPARGIVALKDKHFESVCQHYDERSREVDCSIRGVVDELSLSSARLLAAASALLCTSRVALLVPCPSFESTGMCDQAEMTTMRR
jgi:hypothetical protein